MMTSAEKLSHYSASTGTCELLTLTMPHEFAGLRLDQALQRLLPYSRNQIQTWIRKNLVTLDGSITTPKRKIWGGEKIVLTPIDLGSESVHVPEAIALNIVFEDDTLLIINKPAGLVVHPGSGNRAGTLLNALLHHLPALEFVPRAGIVHRLDKDTSGLLVVAKTLAAHSHLIRQFQARTIKREYLALVHGKIIGEGTVEAPIGRHPVDRVKMVVSIRGKQAITHYRVEQQFDRFTLLRCNLESGRTHQIRVHMQSIEHPILGDPVYGIKTPQIKPREEIIRFPRQALHATKLELVHPISGERMSWSTDLPDDMKDLLSHLKTRLK